jgi:hypothetical protein
VLSRTKVIRRRLVAWPSLHGLCGKYHTILVGSHPWWIKFSLARGAKKVPRADTNIVKACTLAPRGQSSVLPSGLASTRICENSHACSVMSYCDRLLVPRLLSLLKDSSRWVNVTKGVNKVSTVLGDAPITPAPGESSKGATATRRQRPESYTYNSTNHQIPRLDPPGKR